MQAYIGAMQGWQQDIGRRLDALVTGELPDVRKAVKWNSPFFGVSSKGWFLSFHCFTKYVKVAFHNGAQLTPVPPGGSKHPDTRYLDIRQHHELDERQFLSWVRQAAKLPGWLP